MKRDDALAIGIHLVDLLRPACDRIEIAGSVRRGKSEVHDIEIVAIPKQAETPRERPEFGKPIPKAYKNPLDKLVDQLRNEGLFSIMKNGEKFKKLLWRGNWVDIDLFLVTPPAQWGVLYLIRTGPGDFSHWMVTRESLGGALPDQYIVQDGVVGQRIKGKRGFERQGEFPMPEEVDFFQLCGLEWMEPGARKARWSMRCRSF